MGINGKTEAQKRECIHSQLQWCTLVTPALQEAEAGDNKFEPSLDSLVT